MTPTKILALALLALGAVLFFFGYNATEAPVEQLRESLTGRYSDRTIAFFVCAAISAAVGVGLLFKK